MSRKKTQKAITTLAVTTATILAWLSGFFVMQVVYNSIAAAFVFGTVCAIIVFCMSRFSYISLKSDGRIAITKTELRSNLWHIVAATLVALLVTIPLELKIYSAEILSVAENAGSNLGIQLKTFVQLLPSHWLPATAIAIAIVAIYQIPIFVKMASEE